MMEQKVLSVISYCKALITQMLTTITIFAAIIVHSYHVRPSIRQWVDNYGKKYSFSLSCKSFSSGRHVLTGALPTTHL